MSKHYEIFCKLLIFYDSMLIFIYVEYCEKSTYVTENISVSFKKKKRKILKFYKCLHLQQNSVDHEISSLKSSFV